MKPPIRSIHARCGATRSATLGILVCGKSHGHKNPEHYDPSADTRWFDTPGAKR